MDSIINIFTKTVNNLTTLRLSFYLDDTFDLNKFSKSIEEVSEQISIPIKIAHINEIILLLNYEIYICINDKIMALKCSHKHYDAESIYIILNEIDNKYKNLNTNETIYFGDSFLENKFIFSSLLNNILNEPFNFEISDDLVLFEKVTSNNSIEVINNIHELFKHNDLVIVINTRKNLNISKKMLGDYTYVYYLKSGENNWVSELKNIKNISEIPAPSIPNLNDNFIVINSYLKYKIPSFCVKQLPNYLNFLKYYIFITPKDKDGISSIYMNKNLYNFYIENINIEN
jgi:hypothetical protein